MAKVETIDFRSFVKNEWRSERKRDHAFKVVALGGGLFAVLAPKLAYAQATKADNSFSNIYSAIMNLADWICVGVLIFAGGMWMLGHRSKALEYAIGCCCGYLLCRHAIDIRDFLKSI
ncbi:TrbC/VirB2 family protein [Fictibacillus sp. Mic-4]|uniref:TrbC/VirB2 family protein n=1 Tax=Fictibacillus sp. Mic-4 TaxID=3132826 RepID=UPI003CEAF006